MRDPYLYRSPQDGKFHLIATDLSIYNRGGWFENEQGYYDASTTGSSKLVLWISDDLGYLPLSTTDIEDVKNERKSWKVLTDKEYSFDKLKKRHGTIISITEDELIRIKKKYC